jgi:S-DNA-T family DNA segregation ATPase FtsK/SpoIIIE
MGAVVARIRDPGGPRDPLVVLVDDLDVAVSRLEAEHQAALLELVAVVVREGPPAGVALAVAGRRAGGALQAVGAAAGPPVILPLPTRQEHVLAGGDARLFDARATPGAGEWRGERIQVAQSPAGPSAPDAARVRGSDPAPPAVLDSEAVHALVTSSPVAAVARLRASGVDAVEAADLPPGWQPVPTRGPTVVVADPDGWLARGPLLAAIRRTGSVVLEGCAPRDVRTLLRVRPVPPPLAPVPGRAWLVTPAGDVRRASWPPRREAAPPPPQTAPPTAPPTAQQTLPQTPQPATPPPVGVSR